MEDKMDIRIRATIFTIINIIVYDVISGIQTPLILYTGFVLYLYWYFKFLAYPVFQNYINKNKSTDNIPLFIYSVIVTYFPILSCLHAIRLFFLEKLEFRGILKEGTALLVISILISTIAFQVLIRNHEILDKTYINLSPVYLISGELHRSNIENKRQIETADQESQQSISRCFKEKQNFHSCIEKELYNVIVDSKLTTSGISRLYRNLTMVLTNLSIPLLLNRNYSEEELLKNVKKDYNTLMGLHLKTCILSKFNDHDYLLFNFAAGAIMEKFLVQINLLEAKHDLNLSIKQLYFYFLFSTDAKFDYAKIINYFNSFPDFKYCSPSTSAQPPIL